MNFKNLTKKNICYSYNEYAMFGRFCTGTTDYGYCG